MKWLLMDSCGAEASIALGDDERVLAVESVPGRSFSAQWPSVLGGLLERAGWGVDALEVVGVVHGPGSFTGVRVGLAAAKGLCEAMGIKLVTLSRLEVLERKGNAVAVLDAGRGEFYLRQEGQERLLTRDAALAFAERHEVVAVEERVIEGLAGARLVGINAADALPLLLEQVRAGQFADLAGVDANYVRGEGELYASQGKAQ